MLCPLGGGGLEGFETHRVAPAVDLLFATCAWSADLMRRGVRSFTAGHAQGRTDMLWGPCATP